MGNGEDLLKTIEEKDQQEIRNLRHWDKQLDSDHDHRLIIDAVDSLLKRNRKVLKAISTVPASDQTQEIPPMSAEEIPLKTRIKTKTSMTLFGGLVKFDGLDFDRFVV